MVMLYIFVLVPEVTMNKVTSLKEKKKVRKSLLWYDLLKKKKFQSIKFKQIFNQIKSNGENRFWIGRLIEHFFLMDIKKR